jgi:hypothetical protein
MKRRAAAGRYMIRPTFRTNFRTMIRSTPVNIRFLLA